jgi:hypothetical protein
MDAILLGTPVINPGPPAYATQEWNRMPRRTLYLESFATDRRYAGQVKEPLRADALG